MLYNATHNNKQANVILALYDSYYKLYCQYSILVMQPIYMFGTKPLSFHKLNYVTCKRVYVLK